MTIVTPFDFCERLIEIEHLGANRAEIEVPELGLPRAILDRGDAQDRRNRRGHLFDLGESGLHGLAQLFNSRVVVEGALDLGAGDSERSAQIMGDVVACALELLEQARDFVQHEIDRARHFVDVAVLVGDRQTRIELAIHDPDDGVVNAFESLRRASGEKCANRQNHQNCRQERDRHRAQQRPLEAIGFPQAAPEQQHAAAREPAGDENGGLAGAARIRQRLVLNDMRPAVDRNGGHGPHVAEHQAAVWIKQRDEIQPTDVPRQPQLQRLAQLSLAVALAPGRFVDENCAGALKIAGVHLPVNERESRGRRQGDSERERKREAKRPRVEDLKRPHSV